MLEIIFAIFIMAIAISSVAYVFAAGSSDIKRSRTLTEASFLAQSIMEVSLIVEPFVDQARTDALPPYEGFSYEVTQLPWAHDSAYFEIHVKVYKNSVSPTKPLATCSMVRKRGGEALSSQ